MTLPGTKPARPQHLQPISTAVPSPRGHNPIETLDNLQHDVVDGMYHPYRRNIPAHVDPDELRDNAGAWAFSNAALALKPALDAAIAHRDAATQAVVDATRVGEVPEEQTGQGAAIWNRAKDRIDKANGVPKKVAAMQDLIRGARGLALQVYQNEFPFYAKTEGLPTDWLTAAFAAERPEVADKVQTATLLHRQVAVGQHNHQKIMRAMEADTDVPTLLDPFAVDAAPYTNPATGG